MEKAMRIIENVREANRTEIEASDVGFPFIQRTRSDNNGS